MVRKEFGWKVLLHENIVENYKRLEIKLFFAKKSLSLTFFEMAEIINFNE